MVPKIITYRRKSFELHLPFDTLPPLCCTRSYLHYNFRYSHVLIRSALPPWVFSRPKTTVRLNNNRMWVYNITRFDLQEICAFFLGKNKGVRNSKHFFVTTTTVDLTTHVHKTQPIEHFDSIPDRTFYCVLFICKFNPT